MCGCAIGRIAHVRLLRIPARGLALRIIEALDLVTLRVRSNAMLCAVRARNDIMWTRWHARRRRRRRRPSRARLTVCSAR